MSSSAPAPDPQTIVFDLAIACGCVASTPLWFDPTTPEYRGILTPPPTRPPYRRERLAARAVARRVARKARRAELRERWRLRRELPEPPRPWYRTTLGRRLGAAAARERLGARVFDAVIRGPREWLRRLAAAAAAAV